MNRSLLDAEIEFHLRAREMKRATARRRHGITEMEAKRPGLPARLLVLLRKKLYRQPEWEWDRAGRQVSKLERRTG